MALVTVVTQAEHTRLGTSNSRALQLILELLPASILEPPVR